MWLLHTYTPNPYLIEWGIFKIHWYGFLMVVGGLLGLLLVLRLARFYKIKKQDIFDLVFYFVIFAVLGARIYYVLYAWEFYKTDLLGILRIWEGGLAVHGIMLGGFVAVIFFAYRKKIAVWKLLDLTVIGLVCAQILGRWGNYFNQELFGKPVEWGIAIEPMFRPLEYAKEKFFHPVVMYESLGNVLVLGILLLVFWFLARERKIYGAVFSSYLILYSVLRFVLEFWRVDYSPEIFGVRWAMIASGALILLGTGLLVKILRKD